ncbi:MAG: hypothetical protein COU90_03735 [Candidatus Ryanbacteria bacterium CG10_big_fil_rev_8_21_14_0_10_43_42]|uniref:Uncharacterized protein n=1 Tax=Candidatus Ryanbacteria bacterium CG10_big_fil_rev_8_21_14_0_10_43_42 TaxID=1974864 RepID=A0A2M8KWD1_9BACT|nr:MAG: hypothetical protein COU90_03735 [Candidatus Ryanbacteria bacterium CG10_big_fil_rev_8_21_14_0_10_43_42]
MSTRRIFGELLLVIFAVFLFSWVGLIPDWGTIFFGTVLLAGLALYLIFRFRYFLSYHGRIRKWAFLFVLAVVLARILLVWNIGSLNIGLWASNNIPWLHGATIERRQITEKKIAEEIRPPLGEMPKADLCYLIRDSWEEEMEEVVAGTGSVPEKTEKLNLLKYQAHAQMARAECSSVDDLLTVETELFCGMVRRVWEKDIEDIRFRGGSLSLRERDEAARIRMSEMENAVLSCGKPATAVEMTTDKVREYTNKACAYIGDSYAKKIADVTNELVTLDVETDEWVKKNAEREKLLSDRKTRLAACEKSAGEEKIGIIDGISWRQKLSGKKPVEILAAMGHITADSIGISFFWGLLLAFLILWVVVATLLKHIVKSDAVLSIVGLLVLVLFFYAFSKGGGNTRSISPPHLLERAVDSHDGFFYKAGEAYPNNPHNIKRAGVVPAPIVMAPVSPTTPVSASTIPAASCVVSKVDAGRVVGEVEKKFKEGCGVVRVIIKHKEAYFRENEICSGTTNLKVVSGIPWLYHASLDAWIRMTTGPMPSSIAKDPKGFSLGGNDFDMIARPAIIDVSCS